VIRPHPAVPSDGDGLELVPARLPHNGRHPREHAWPGAAQCAYAELPRTTGSPVAGTPRNLIAHGGFQPDIRYVVPWTQARAWSRGLSSHLMHGMTTAPPADIPKQAPAPRTDTRPAGSLRPTPSATKKTPLVKKFLSIPADTVSELRAELANVTGHPGARLRENLDGQRHQRACEGMPEWQSELARRCVKHVDAVVSAAAWPACRCLELTDTRSVVMIEADATSRCKHPPVGQRRSTKHKLRGADHPRAARGSRTASPPYETSWDMPAILPPHAALLGGIRETGGRRVRALVRKERTRVTVRRRSRLPTLATATHRAAAIDDTDMTSTSWDLHPGYVRRNQARGGEIRTASPPRPARATVPPGRFTLRPTVFHTSAGGESRRRGSTGIATRCPCVKPIRKQPRACTVRSLPVPTPGSAWPLSGHAVDHLLPHRGAHDPHIAADREASEPTDAKPGRARHAMDIERIHEATRLGLRRVHTAGLACESSYVHFFFRPAAGRRSWPEPHQGSSSCAARAATRIQAGSRLAGAGAA